MSLLEFLFHSNNYLFTAAIILMLFIAILEGVLAFLGAGISDMIESFIPDISTDFDIDGAQNAFALSKFFAWIRIKQVPILMLLIIFLTSFGLVGLFIQLLLLKFTSIFWSVWIVSIPTIFCSVFLLRIIGGFVSFILPKDESSSISKDELIGYIATITLGSAKKNSPAEARTKDKHGQTHYFMIEPDMDEIEFSQGDRVLILGKIKSHFFATNILPNKLK